MPLVAAAAPDATGCGQPEAAGDVVWTSAAGDGAWRTPGNWVDGEGHERVPSYDDWACVDTRISGEVIVPAGTRVGALVLGAGLDDPPVTLLGSLEFFLVGGTGVLRVQGRSRLDGVALEPGRIEIAPGADVDAGRPWINDSFDDRAIPLEVEGTLHIGNASLDGAVVLPGGRIDSSYAGGDVNLVGVLDIRPGAEVVLGRPSTVYVDPAAEIVGELPRFVDATILHLGPFTLEAIGEVTVIGVGPDSTLRLRPDGERMTVHGRGDDPIVNLGTLDIRGVPGGPAVVRLPVAPVDAPIASAGTLLLDGVQVRGTLTNSGTAKVGNFTWIRGEGTSIENSGRLEVGAPFGSGGLLTASLLISGPLRNTGTVVATDPRAEITAEGVIGSAPIGPRINVVGDGDGEGVDSGVRPGPSSPLVLDELGWGTSRVHLGVRGLASVDAGRVKVTRQLVEFGDARGFDLDVAGGYVPCDGSRWQLLTRPSSVVGYRPPGSTPGSTPGVARGPVDLRATGLPAGVTVSLIERTDGFVAVASGTPTDGATCSDTPGARMVSGLFVDGLGRPARPDQLADFGARSATTAGRTAVARELLGGETATQRFADVELRRILGRPASRSAVVSWATRLRAATPPDQMRAEAHGGTAAWKSAGSTPAGWTNRFYGIELGRRPTAAETNSVAAALRAGSSRTAVARWILAGAEADRVLAERSIALWRHRSATPAERSTWAQRYQTAPELTVTADLAATAP